LHLKKECNEERDYENFIIFSKVSFETMEFMCLLMLWAGQCNDFGIDNQVVKKKKNPRHLNRLICHQFNVHNCDTLISEINVDD